MTCLRTFVFVVMAASAVYSASFFTDRGSVQVGGGISFETTGRPNRDGRYNEFALMPVVNFFPLPYFLVGPVVDMIVAGWSGEASLRLDLGARAGFAYGNNMVVFPFAYASPQLLINVNRNNKADPGFGMEIAGGIIIPVRPQFSINIGPGFWFEIDDGNFVNTFFMGASVTGLIF